MESEEPSSSSAEFEAQAPAPITLWKDMNPVNWQLCVFCQAEKPWHGLCSVMTKNVSSRYWTYARVDFKLGVRFASVHDLIAAEGKYHFSCLTQFYKTVDKTKKVIRKSDLAMVWLCQELWKAFAEGHIVLLSDVWQCYLNLASESNTAVPQSFHTRQSTFKMKLISEVGDIFTFYHQLDEFPSAVTEYEERLPDPEESISLPKYQPGEDIMLSIIHVASKVRGDILAKPGHKDFQVTENDIVLSSLYKLLRLINGHSAIENDSCNEEKLQSKVLLTAQDVIYGVSRGRKWTPKHLGLGCTLHQATMSKDLVKFFSQSRKLF